MRNAECGIIKNKRLRALRILNSQFIIHNLKSASGAVAGGAFFRRVGPVKDVCAAGALPFDGGVRVEQRVGLKPFEDLRETNFVLALAKRDGLEPVRDLVEALRPGLLGKFRVQIGPFVPLDLDGRAEIRLRVAGFRELNSHGEFHLSTLQALEKAPGVRPFLRRYLTKRPCNDIKPFLLGLRRVKIVLILRLRLAGKGLKEIFFRLGSANIHNFSRGWRG